MHIPTLYVALSHVVAFALGFGGVSLFHWIRRLRKPK